MKAHRFRCPGCGCDLVLSAPLAPVKHLFPDLPARCPERWRVLVYRRPLVVRSALHWCGPAAAQLHPSELPSALHVAQAWGGGQYRLRLIEGYGGEPDKMRTLREVEITVEAERLPLKRPALLVRQALAALEGRR